MDGLCLYLLGAPRLERDGRPLTTDTRKALALLAYLAVTGRAHTRDTLAMLLWGDSDDQRARAALRRTLSVLRTAAGEGIVNTTGDAIGPGDGLWCDVTAFRGGVAQGELRSAVAVFQGPFLSGFNLRDSPDFEEWQFLEGEALNRELAEALSRLASDAAADGDYKAALAHARRLLALDSLNEEAHRLLMTLYAYSGDVASALRQYRECVRVLEQELGVSPLSETAELYQRIRENRLPRLSLAGPLAPAPAAQQEPAGAPPAVRTPALAGRAAQWSALTHAYGKSAAGGYCVALEGEAGIGKTRLAEDFLDYAARLGGHVASGRCYEGETGIAYGPVIQVLRGLAGHPACRDRLAFVDPSVLAEVARLLPELAPAGLSAPPAVTDPGAAARFLEGLRRFMTTLCSGSAPAVLFFDDLHWADAASLDFLTYLVRRLAGENLFVVLAWQTDGSHQVERLRALLAECARNRLGVLLPLSRLALADVLALVRDWSATGAPRPEGLAGRIYHDSEGVPLFVLAYLESAAKALDAAPRLPASVRDALAARVRGIGEAEHQLLQAAAVLGRSFDLDVLQATSGRSVDETLAGLERLVSRGLIHEVHAAAPGITYDFDHGKLRDLLYAETSLGRRRLLHERAGRALVAVGARRRSAHALASLAAYHLAQAGQEAEAAEQHVLAGGHAERLYANLEALEHYRAALAYGYPDHAGLCEKIGDLETLRGDYQAALTAYEAAAASVEGAAEGAGALEHKLGNLHARLGDWSSAHSFYEAADRLLPGARDSRRARLYADWSLVSHQRGEVEPARRLARLSLELAEETRDLPALAQAHNIEGILLRAEAGLPAALHSLEKSYKIAAQTGDPGLQAAALNNLALAYAGEQRFDEAVDHLQTALALCSRQGDRHREAALRNNLADVLHAAGRDEDAMVELKSAVALFAEIGLQAGESRAEIWRLTEW